MDLGLYEEVLKYYNEALSIKKKNGDVKEENKIVRKIVDVQKLLGKHSLVNADYVSGSALCDLNMAELIPIQPDVIDSN